jgi:hypothetical protein
MIARTATAEIAFPKFAGMMTGALEESPDEPGPASEGKP